jgi:hypothetical protein
VDFACLYFTPAALTAAAGEEVTKFEIRPAIGVQAPTLCKLVRALHADAAQGHPYGKMLGDSIFVSMARCWSTMAASCRIACIGLVSVIGAFDGRLSIFMPA